MTDYPARDKEDQLCGTILCLSSGHPAEAMAVQSGYANSDIMIGIIYPHEFEEEDWRESGIQAIPPGYVLLWSDFDEITWMLPEAEYLDRIVQQLKEEGRLDKACKVEAILAGLPDRP